MGKRNNLIRILGVSIAIVAVLVFVFNIFNNNSSDSFTVSQPRVYTEPLVIATFDIGLSLTPLEARASEYETVDEKTIKYTDAYINTDVVQITEEFRLKEDIVLKEPGHPGKFEYTIDIGSLRYRHNYDGSIDFIEKQDISEQELLKRFTIPAPFMIDATGKRSSTDDVKMSLSADGTLTLVPDPEWLATHEYPIVLDPTVEISVLNLHSHPSRGQNWVVDFTTVGSEDLYIIPDDQATIDDDEFLYLECGDDVIDVEILEGDVIYAPNWECEGVGHVTHYTLVAGDHKLRFEFGDQVAYAYNAATAGDYMVRRNESETTTITSSVTDFGWDTLVASSGSSITYSGGNFTLASGKYLISWGEAIDTTNTSNNERQYVIGGLRLGGTATTTGAGSGYIRKQNGNQEAFPTGMTMLYVESDSTTVDTYMQRLDNASAGTVTRTANLGGISILALDDSHLFARYTVDSSQAIGNEVSSLDVVWDNTNEEDTGFSRTNDAITIPATAGRYFVTYTMHINNGGGDARADFSSRITVGGSNKDGTSSSCYLRGLNAAGEEEIFDCVIRWGGIMDLSASDVIRLNVTHQEGGTDAANVEPGSSIEIWQLPAGAETIVVHAETDNGTAFNPSAETDFTWVSRPHMDADSFSHTAGDTAIVVDEAGDYFFTGSLYAGADDPGNRSIPRTRFRIGNTATTTVVGGCYGRGSGNADYCGVSIGALLTNLSASDSIEVSTQEVGQGTVDTLNNDDGSFTAFRLSTVFSGGNATPAISSVTDTPDPANPQQTVTFSVDWSDADAGENIKAKICSTDVLSAQNCTGTTYASSSSFTTSDPEDITYVASGDDAGSNTYYAYVCDDEGACVSSGSGTSGTFTVNATSTITSVTDTPDPTNPGRSVSFIVDWADSGDQVKGKVCKTDSLTNQVCDGGEWATSSAFTTKDPFELHYDVVGADAGQTRSYYVFVCDDNGLCTDTSTSGTFDVNIMSLVPNVKFR